MWGSAVAAVADLPSVSWACAPSGTDQTCRAFAGSSGGAGGLHGASYSARRRHGTVLKSGRSFGQLSAFFGGVSGGSRWRRRSKLPPPLPLLAVVRLLLHLGGGVCVADQALRLACRAFKGTAWAGTPSLLGFSGRLRPILRLPLTWAWLWLLSWPALLAGKGAAPRVRCCFPRVRAAPLAPATSTCWRRIHSQTMPSLSPSLIYSIRGIDHAAPARLPCARASMRRLIRPLLLSSYNSSALPPSAGRAALPL